MGEQGEQGEHDAGPEVKGTRYVVLALDGAARWKLGVDRRAVR